MNNSTISHQVQEAMNRLKEKGFKSTKKRREILEIFDRHPKYLSAKVVHQELAQEYPTMSYNTTYRNIYDFVDAGILEATEYNGEQHFRMNCLEHGHHHHHFICTECGMAIPFDVCPMEIRSVQDKLSEVEVHSHRFEIFGLCKDCIRSKESLVSE